MNTQAFLLLAGLEWRRGVGVPGLRNHNLGHPEVLSPATRTLGLQKPLRHWGYSSDGTQEPCRARQAQASKPPPHVCRWVSTLSSHLGRVGLSSRPCCWELGTPEYQERPLLGDGVVGHGSPILQDSREAATAAGVCVANRFLSSSAGHQGRPGLRWATWVPGPQGSLGTVLLGAMGGWFPCLSCCVSQGPCHPVAS